MNQLWRSLVLLLLPIGITTAAAADLTLYDDAVAANWGDWSWGGTYSANNPSPVHAGSHSLSAQPNAWGGVQLGTNSPVATAAYDTLQFWIHGGVAGGQTLQVSIDDSGTAVAVTANAGAWKQVKITLADLGYPAQIGKIAWWNGSGNTLGTFYLDDIVLTNQGLPPPPPPPTGTGPNLHVDVAAARHAISDGIYGMNFTDEGLAAELALPIRRWGGNSTSRYNWQASITNTGNDWYYENVPDDVNVANLPNGSTSDLFVEQNKRTGTATLMTVPLIGWTAKASSPRTHPFACGFKVSKYGAQADTDSQWDADCGNGVKPAGGNITGNNPADTSTAITPQFVKDWIAHLIANYGAANSGGVAYYNLDNEPMLWNSTHRDVHPNPTTYNELRDATYQYAAAIKDADPAAKTLGPVLWGWCAYFYSAADGCGAGSDRAAHGNTDFVPWYLQQMKLYEQQHGRRILDYLDLHMYPQVDGVYSESAGNAATKALRLRSTRGLWDPTYTDEGWIHDTVKLIPRMKDWVAANYPGTGLAITEYSWGAMGDINGALAQADVLGILGREGVDIATLWGPPTTAQPGAYAFRMYRNYDGAGHRFGETSVSAVSANQDKLAVYAAQRTADGALTVVVVNKDTSNLQATLDIAGFFPAANASVYRYGSDNLNAVQHLADQPVTAGTFTTTYPINSITLFVFASSVPPPAAPTLLRLVPGNDRMQVYFEPANGSTATGYTATCTGGGASHSQSGTASPITVTGLTRGVSYVCTVHASNSGGNSAESTGLTKVARRQSILPPMMLLLGG